jgi:cytochrome c peroxidase
MSFMRRLASSIMIVSLAGCTGVSLSDGVIAQSSAVSAAGEDPPPTLPNTNPSLTAEMPSTSGRFQTFSTAANGRIDTSNPFFLSLGSNGRACIHCHQAQDGWTITPAHVQARFEATTPKGIDPIFRLVDGANSPVAEVGSEDNRRTAYSLLLQKGLIRIGLPVPPTADYQLVGVEDPYGYASARELSMYRRPLPTTNLKFLATVMWDGRETLPTQTINFDLAHQSNSATVNHAQAMADLDEATRSSIVAFELTLFTAATFDNDAHELIARLATGGPENLAATDFHIGINDVLGGDPAPGAPPFSPDVFHAYDTWVDSTGTATGTDGARATVARGQAIFNRRPINISGVRGINDALGIEVLPGTCTTCHDTPSAGNHSVSLPIDIGLADASRRTPDLPLYTFRETTTGALHTTTDPGRGLVNGRFADLSKFKGPILRALAARPPFFHNGSAATLDAVVDFYNGRFALALSAQEHNDLVAFLKTL